MSNGLLTAEQRRAVGREARASHPRVAQANWQAGPGRGNTVAALRAADAKRIPALLPLR